MYLTPHRLWVTALLLTSCGDEPASTPAPPSGCPQLWQGETRALFASGAAEVRDGALALQLTDAVNGDLLIVSQDGRFVAGDFTVWAEFADLVRNTTEGTVEIEARPASDLDGFTGARAAIDNNTLDAAVAGTDNLVDTSYAVERDATAGTFQIERTGTQMVASVVAGESETFATGQFDAENVAIRIRLLNLSTSADDVAARITSFGVAAQDGTLRSDDFTCDSFVGMVP